jgi:hypothetical protein
VRSGSGHDASPSCAPLEHLDCEWLATAANRFQLDPLITRFRHRSQGEI